MTVLGQPPPEALRAAINAAEYAAHDDPARCCATIAESTCDPGWLLIASVHLLASVIRDGLPADELRGEVLGIAAQTNAPGYNVRAAIEAVLMAEAVESGDLDGLRQLCDASHIAALDLAHSASAIGGQTIASLADHPAVVFDRMRRFYGIEDGAP